MAFSGTLSKVVQPHLASIIREFDFHNNILISRSVLATIGIPAQDNSREKG
jgi:hypothetical protein